MSNSPFGDWRAMVGAEDAAPEIPRKDWRYRGMGRYVVAQDLAGGVVDVYRGANTLAGARKAKREVSHWRAYIIDQATGARV